MSKSLHGCDKNEDGYGVFLKSRVISGAFIFEYPQISQVFRIEMRAFTHVRPCAFQVCFIFTHVFFWADVFFLRTCVFFFRTCIVLKHAAYKFDMHTDFNFYQPNVSFDFRLIIPRWNKHDLGTYLANMHLHLLFILSNISSWRSSSNAQ